MRVAHLGNFNPDSADGTEKTIAGLVTWLPRHGVDVEVWQLVWGGRQIARRHVDGCTVWELPAYTPPGGFVWGLTPAARNFIIRRTHSGAVSHVHLHSGFIPENSAAAHLLAVPYVVAPNGMYSSANLAGRDARFKRLWLSLFDRRLIRRAAMLHAVSDGEAESLRALAPRAHIRVIPNAVDAPAASAIPPTDRQLLFLGRLAVEQKGLDLLVQAFARYLAMAADTSTRLVIVGPDYRGGEAAVRLMVAALGLQNRVELRKPVFGTEKWELLSSAFAFVYPSRWDGLPFSVLEALAVRRPVLVTPGTNLAGMVASYAAGEAVEPTVDALAAGIGRIVSVTPEAWSHMAAGAHRMVEQHFTWDAAARLMAQAYRDLSPGTNSSPTRKAAQHVA